MSTLTDKIKEAYYLNGCIVILSEGGAEYRFPVSENPRLSGATQAQLSNMEISPFGLHWPELEEDLSFRGIARGDYGQSSGGEKSE